MILVIDNYDSFTYNLVQYLGELGADLEVRRNDEVSLAEVKRMKPERIVISPGPGRPEDAGVSNRVIEDMGRNFYGLSLVRHSARQSNTVRVVGGH